MFNIFDLSIIYIFFLIQQEQVLVYQHLIYLFYFSNCLDYLVHFSFINISFIKFPLTTYFNLHYIFPHSNVFFGFIKYYIQFTKLKWSKNYMVLCNSFSDISLAVKKTKILIKIVWRNYLAITNYIVQYKLQYGKHNRE